MVQPAVPQGPSHGSRSKFLSHVTDDVQCQYHVISVTTSKNGNFTFKLISEKTLNDLTLACIITMTRFSSKVMQLENRAPTFCLNSNIVMIW